MTFLTNREISERYGPTKEEVTEWLKKRRLKPTRTNRSLAVRRLTASKIKAELGRDITGFDPTGNWQIIYGRALVGGTVTFISSGTNNEYLHLVVTVAGHEIDAIEKLYLDDQEVIFGASPDARWSTGIYDPRTNTTRTADTKVFMAVNNGNPSNPAISDLIAQLPTKWTSNHKQTGRAHVYIILKWDAVLFPNGIPEISFLVRGRKCFDPRTGTTGWTQNAALQILDYLTNTQFGLGVPIAECEIASGVAGSWRTAADICDESVAILSGGTEARYTGNGYFEIGNSHQTNIETLTSAMAGSITFSGGKYRCWPARWTSPVLTITEADVLEDISVQSKISRRDNFNSVAGTYVNPKARYEEADFPAVSSTLYVTQDEGIRITEDIQLPFTTSSATAQRIAKIHLERIRQSITVDLVGKISLLRVEVGETVELTWARLGWNAKTFEVEESEVLLDADETNPTISVRLLLRESASGVYDWNNGQETTVDLSPNTDLPSPFTVQTPTISAIESGTAQLYLRSDGTVFSRMKVTWASITDSFVLQGGRIELQYRRDGTTTWSTLAAISADSTSTHILDVQDGTAYNVRIRAQNALGAYSDYSSIITHTVIGKTQPPGQVQGFSAQVLPFGIAFKWDALSDLDIDHYHVKRTTAGVDWATATSISEVGGTALTVEQQVTGTYTYLIKAIDTSNNESAVASQITVGITGPEAPTSFTFVISGPDVVLTWAPSVGQFQVAEYEIRFGNTFATATTVTRTKGTTLLRKVEYGGLGRWWVVGIDVAGNVGTPASVDVNITQRSAVTNLKSEIVDNNVLLKWTAPTTGTLPIDTYRVLKGTTFAGATLVGQVAGTFSALFEIIAGTFTYWVVAVDSAGNQGVETSITAIVSQPPDYTILSDQTLDVNVGTLTNCLVINGELWIGINTTETWQQHFVNNGYTTPQDQINAGNPYYLQPSTSTASFVRTIDYGSTIASAIIKVSFISTQITGTTSITTKIATSLDNATWTEVTGTQTFAQNFRYVRLTITKP